MSALPPEPADGAALYWPARTADEFPFMIVRDDAAGRLFGDGLRWFQPNYATDFDPTTWDGARQWLADEGLPLDEAIVLHPAGGGLR